MAKTKNIKRKVQAQRKFAQGAILPPPTSNNVQKIKHGSIKEPKIIYQQMSAKNLLDLVSLKSVHPHLQPYVLLERIDRSSGSSDLDLLRPTKIVPKLKSNKITCDMRLRPRVVCTNGIKRRKYHKKPKRQQSPSQFSHEDNTPLKYFATVPAEKKAQKRLNNTTTDSYPREKRKKRPSLRWASDEYMLTRSRSKSVPRRVITSPSPLISGPATLNGRITPLNKIGKLYTRSKKIRITRTARLSRSKKPKDKSVIQEVPPVDDFDVLGRGTPQSDPTEDVIVNDKIEKQMAPANKIACHYGFEIPSTNNTASGTAKEHLPLSNPYDIEDGVGSDQIIDIIPRICLHGQSDFPQPDPAEDFEPPSEIDEIKIAATDKTPYNTSMTVWKEKDVVNDILPLEPDLNEAETFNNQSRIIEAQSVHVKRSICIPSRYSSINDAIDNDLPDIIPSGQRIPEDNEISRAESTANDNSIQYYRKARTRNWIMDTCYQKQINPTPSKTFSASDTLVIIEDNDSSHNYQLPTKVEASEVVVIEDYDTPENNEEPLGKCLVRRFRTLKDLCNATNETINFCNDNCRLCKILKSLHTVIKKARSPSHQINDDIYDFNSLRDDVAVDPQMSLRERRRQRMSRSQEHAATDDENRLGIPVYLDILPQDSPNITKLMPVKNLDQAELKLQACLIHKSNAKNVKIHTLDVLLEDVIRSLVPNSGRLEVITEPLKPPEESQFIYSPDSYTGSGGIGEPSTSKAEIPTKRFPKHFERAKLVDAPIFHPTKEEFLDPIAYFDKIMPSAAKFGICKVVAPEEFKPTCYLNESFKFNVTNQYICRLYNRWSPVTREICAIKHYSASQNVVFNTAPLVEGLEINLSKLYHIIQRHGGLQNVIRKQRWHRVAEEMRFTKGPNPGNKLDLVYVKYLLPYEALAYEEKQKITAWVEKSWQKKYQKMLERALHPMRRQRRLLGETNDETDSSDNDSEEECTALADAEDCIVAGRPMNLKNFKKVASNALDTYYPKTSSLTTEHIEKEYWRLVLLNTEHVCVNSASIDTGVEGYGFSIKEDDPYSKHPWNLKVISNNSGNVLRSLGSVLGVTVPTLHLGMLYSTSCWHRDPHGLPWIEYLHSGPGKIWYGIPDDQSNNFRKAVEKLCPTLCQNKTIWLPSDITMIPPSLLMESNVSLSRVVQSPGEFIIVFPKSYSSSFSLGFTQSESVYFATQAWLNTIHQVFEEARTSCEPTMFAVEQFLIDVARDPRVPLSVLQQVHSNLNTLLEQELQFRRSIEFYNIRVKLNDKAQRDHSSEKTRKGAFNVRDLDECQICRATLYLSMVTGVLGKRSTVCLQHSIALLEKQETVRPNSLELVIYYSNEELNRIIVELQSIIMPPSTPQPRSPQPGPSSAP